ncbi:integrase family protein [Candidatus Jidaibacter acanthamoebae]|uniref:integrase family protein n=1 Tax=Candidatus Jidaibacter acanthamoebae TaxID=86105 RepID=UPI001EFA036F|nr:integrase family protein [Candidatus Jidaibacter acanthamoeba]
MKDKIYNFTKKFLDELPISAPGKRDYCKDYKGSGLEIIVTDKGNKSFEVTKKNGRIIRVTIGQYPNISIENARKEALHISSQIAQGIKKFKEKSRDRFLQADELPKFFKALNGEINETAKGYILISLLTGA